MIQEKDASTPCDERHNSSKKINVNLLTQKKTGGKLIMGSQGMTNWKFTAFFAISLMLIAGLFSNAAIAGNGDGTITVGWSSTRDDGTNVPDDSRMTLLGTTPTLLVTRSQPVVEEIHCNLPTQCLLL